MLSQAAYNDCRRTKALFARPRGFISVLKLQSYKNSHFPVCDWKRRDSGKQPFLYLKAGQTKTGVTFEGRGKEHN